MILLKIASLKWPWKFINRKGGECMMAMFFAQRVILGKTAFSDVPAKLQDQVREVLTESGLEELAK